MTDIATIGIKADTTDLKRARDEFGRFIKAGDGVEHSVPRAFKGTENRVNKSALSMAKNVGALAGGFVAGIASMEVAMSSFAAARQFNAALAETATLIDGNAQQMAVITEGARAMSREFGGNATAQVQAYYQALSAGAGSAENATILLDAANKLAIGGVTDVTTGVDVLTTAMNAYRAEGLTAAEASDALFVGMKAGKTTVGQLSASIGQVLPIATSLGVSFDETVAAMAALTTQGISTSQAATGIRAAMTSMIAPTNEAQKLAKSLGIEFSAAGVEALGFGGMMDQIIAKTGGNTALIQQLFGSIEATTAALSFAGGAGEVFGGIMDQMAVKAGATAEAYDVVADSLDQRLKVVLGQAGDAALAFGNMLLTVIVPAAEGAMAAANFLGDNMAAMGLVAASLVATALPSLAVATYGAVTAFAAGTTGAGILTGALGLLRGAVMLAGGPWGILAGLIVAAAGYFLLFRDNASEAKKAMDESRAMSGELNAALGNFYNTAAPSAAGAAIGLANANYELANSAFEAAKAELAKRRAMMESMAGIEAQRSNIDPNDPEAAFLLGASDAAINRYQAQLDELAAAESRLSTVANERRQAVIATTGAMSEHFGETRNAVTGLTGEIAALGNVATGGGRGGALGGMTDEMKALEKAIKEAEKASEQWASQAAGHFDGMITQGKTFGDVLNSLARQLESQGWQTLFSGLAGGKSKSGGGNLFGKILGALFGGGGGTGSMGLPDPFPSLDGGGYTGDGARSGGVDGKGGFMAIMHPQETVIDHTKGGRASNGGDVNISFTVNAQGAQVGVAEQIRTELQAMLPQIAKYTIGAGNDRRMRGLPA